MKQVGPSLVLLYKQGSILVMLAVIVEVHHRIAGRSYNFDFGLSCSIIFKLEWLEKEKSSEADVLLPALITVIVSCHPPQLRLLTRLLTDFLSVVKLKGYEQYCLTNFSAAVSYIQSIELDKLDLDLTLLQGKKSQFL